MAYCGASNSEDQNKIRELRDKYKGNLKELNIEWLKYKKNEVNEFEKPVFDKYIKAIQEK